MAVRHAFKNISDILDKFLRRLKTDDPFLNAIALLHRNIPPTPPFSALRELLTTRQLASETIVKMAVILVGTHWQKRSATLPLLVDFYTILLDVASSHPENVLRRLLPTLRILSKWLKLHINHVQDPQFWAGHQKFINSLSSYTPGSLLNPLEEDLDMRGFIPLARAMTPGTTRLDLHPNEESLMRIADLLVDAKLIDDPVNLAMHAHLEDEEVIVYPTTAPPPLLFGSNIWSMTPQDVLASNKQS